MALAEQELKVVVRELNGEKIDIIRYYPEPQRLLEEALKPAIPRNIQINEERRRIYFEVTEGDLSVTIGRKGLNAKLTSKLVGWKLDIGKEEKRDLGFAELKKKAITGINQIPGIEESLAMRLVEIGINSPAAFEGVTPNDLVDSGFTEEEAARIMGKLEEFNTNSAG